MKRVIFETLRFLLVLLTGKGYDRSERINALHHKLAWRLHKLLPFFGITGIKKIAVPNMQDKSMYVMAEDGGVAHQLIMYRQYEPYESKLARKYLKSGMTVYNIGANLGYYVLLASKAVGNQGEVYAFEPAPENFELLTRTIEENHANNVIAVQTAAGSRNGTAELSLSATNSGDHQLYNIAGRSHVSVAVTTIDIFAEDTHSVPDAIILDVQGAELDVLLGAETLTKNRRPLILFSEFWPQGLNERHPNGAFQFLDILERAGFGFHRIDEKHHKLVATNPKQLLATVIDNQEVNLLCIRD